METIDISDYNGCLKPYQIKALRRYKNKPENKEKMKKWVKEYYNKNKEQIIFNKCKNRAIERIHNGDKVREATLKKYGLEDYEFSDVSD